MLYNVTLHHTLKITQFFNMFLVQTPGYVWVWSLSNQAVHVWTSMVRSPKHPRYKSPLPEVYTPRHHFYRDWVFQHPIRWYHRVNLWIKYKCNTRLLCIELFTKYNSNHCKTIRKYWKINRPTHFKIHSWVRSLLLIAFRWIYRLWRHVGKINLHL